MILIYLFLNWKFLSIRFGIYFFIVIYFILNNLWNNIFSRFHTLSILLSIVFRPGPVQGSGSGFWPGHLVARVNSFFFFKLERCRFSKKKIKNQRIATGSCRVTQSFSFSYFFFNPTRFQPWVDRRAEPGFKTMLLSVRFDIYSFNCYLFYLK